MASEESDRFDEAQSLMRNEKKKSNNRRGRCQFLPAILAIVLLVGFSGGIMVFVDLQRKVRESYLPAGYDYTGGFVPRDVNARPQLVAPDKSEYEISTATFESILHLNNTILAWNKLAPGASFVRSNETKWYGKEMPLRTMFGDVFQIAALHQMHCLTTILRDYALLQMGYGVNQLYNDRSLQNLRSHSAHCFNEIRRALVCFADGTALGHGSDPELVDSVGKIHVCNNYDALLDWATDPVRALPTSVRGRY